MLNVLTCTDRYKQTIWEPWDQPPNLPRGHGMEPDADLALPELRLATARQDTQPRSKAGAGGSELEASMYHPKRSTGAAVTLHNPEPQHQELDSALVSLE